MYSLKMALCESKHLLVSALFIHNKVLRLTKTLLFVLYMKFKLVNHKVLRSNLVQTKLQVWLLTMEAPVCCYGRQCSICGGQIGTRIHFSLNIPVSFVDHTTIIPSVPSIIWGMHNTPITASSFKCT